jgi:muramoyltetrapeptide carboxypeptidase LdcA involved in peptidoglycan recycling
MIKPQKLQPGDTVAAISLSWGGPGTFPHRYEAGKRQLQDEFGLKVVETAHAYEMLPGSIKTRKPELKI